MIAWCRFTTAELTDLDDEGRCVITDHGAFAVFNLVRWFCRYWALGFAALPVVSMSRTSGWPRLHAACSMGQTSRTTATRSAWSTSFASSRHVLCPMSTVWGRTDDTPPSSTASPQMCPDAGPEHSCNKSTSSDWQAPMVSSDHRCSVSGSPVPGGGVHCGWQAGCRPGRPQHLPPPPGPLRAGHQALLLGASRSAVAHGDARAGRRAVRGRFPLASSAQVGACIQPSNYILLTEADVITLQLIGLRRCMMIETRHDRCC